MKQKRLRLIGLALVLGVSGIGQTAPSGASSWAEVEQGWRMFRAGSSVTWHHQYWLGQEALPTGAETRLILVQSTGDAAVRTEVQPVAVEEIPLPSLDGKDQFGVENVVVGGELLTCRWRLLESSEDGNPALVKRWYSTKVPGALVKQVKTVYGRVPRTTVSQVVEYAPY